MKRPDEVELLKGIGLTPDQARVLFGLGVTREIYESMDLLDLWERLSNLKSRPMVREIFAHRRLMFLRASYCGLDDQFWQYVRPQVASRFTQELIPFWFVFSATQTELLQIPGVGTQSVEHVLFMRNNQAQLLEEYTLQRPDYRNQLLVTPTITWQDPELAGPELSEILISHGNRMLAPFDTEFGWIPRTDYAAAEGVLWQILEAVLPACLNHIAIYLPETCTGDDLRFTEDLLLNLFADSPVPLQIEVFGNLKDSIRYSLPLPESLRFELIRMPHGHSIGILQIPLHHEWGLIAELLKLSLIKVGEQLYILDDVEFTKMRLLLSQQAI